MQKKLAALLLIVCFMIMPVLTGCALVEVDPQRDLDSVVAVVCGEQITKRMVMNEWNRQKITMNVNDAFEQSEEGETIIGTVLQNLLQDMVKRIIRREHARELGLYPLTDENYARVVELADQYYDDRLAQAEQALLDSFAETGGDATERDFSAEAEQSVKLTMENQFEFSREMDLRQAEDVVIVELLTEHYGRDVVVDEETLRSEYDSMLETQMEDFSEDTNGVISYLNSGDLIVYYPGEVVRVKHILIGFDEQTQAQIEDLRAAGKDEEADALMQSSAASIQDEADEALARALDGENFDNLIVEYGVDPGMMTQSLRDNGYLICRDSIDYVEAFKQGSLALTQEGQISDLVLSDYGYHIIYAIDVYEEETIPFEDVRDQVEEKTVDLQRGVAYTRAMEAVYEETDVELYVRRLLRGNINTIGYDNAIMVEEYRFPQE